MYLISVNLAMNRDNITQTLQAVAMSVWFNTVHGASLRERATLKAAGRSTARRLELDCICQGCCSEYRRLGDLKTQSSFLTF